jgi:DNA excision repair protein ERCC-5
MALSAIGNRAPKQLPSPTKSFQPTNLQNKKSTPLFDLDENEGEFPISDHILQYQVDDEELAFVIQDSFDQRQNAKASHADSSRALSKTSKDTHTVRHSAPSSPSKRLSKEEDLFLKPTRLETALSIAGTGPSRTNHYPVPSAFGRPDLLSPPPQPPNTTPLSKGEPGDVAATRNVSKSPTPNRTPAPEHAPDVDTLSNSDEDLEEVTGFFSSVADEAGITHGQIVMDSNSEMDMEEMIPERDDDIFRPSDIPSPIPRSPSSLPITGNPPTAGPSRAPALQSVDEEERDDFSRSPSPFRQPSDIGSPRSPSPVHDSWDAAQEMDPHTEESEYARFMSQVKGKNIDVVRREIDDEIESLNQQKKAALRDSEDITQQMISQIMVSWKHSSHASFSMFNT